MGGGCDVCWLTVLHVSLYVYGALSGDSELDIYTLNSTAFRSITCGFVLHSHHHPMASGEAKRHRAALLAIKKAQNTLARVISWAEGSGEDMAVAGPDGMGWREVGD